MGTYINHNISMHYLHTHINVFRQYPPYRKPQIAVKNNAASIQDQCLLKGGKSKKEKKMNTNLYLGT